MPILCRRMVVSASRRGLRGRPKECQLTFGTALSEPPRRLRPQPRPRRRLDQGLRAQPSGWATVMNRPRDHRCRPQGARLRLGFPARLRRTRRHVRARLRRARKVRRLGRHQPSPHRRQDPPRPRPLRPSTSTTGISASAPTASNSSGQLQPTARFINAHRPLACPRKLRFNEIRDLILFTLRNATIAHR
jgi:hypothetical protein